jgi:hypothetical protein
MPEDLPEIKSRILEQIRILPDSSIMNLAWSLVKVNSKIVVPHLKEVINTLMKRLLHIQ